MTDQRPDGVDQNRITVALQRVYLKDCSFEAPNSPGVFTGEWRPTVSLNIGTSTTQVGDGVYEAVLKVTAEAKQDDKLAFLIEVQQAGTFIFQGLNEADLQRALVIFCPQQLYPFAREAIASLSGKGGFPALQLQPVNFEAVAAEAFRQQQAQQAAAGAASAEAGQTPEAGQ
jgi:preprotein translocase subunit SecB